MTRKLKPADPRRADELLAGLQQAQKGALAELAWLYSDALKRLAVEKMSEFEQRPCGASTALQESMLRVAKQDGWYQCKSLEEFENWLMKLLHDAIRDREKYYFAQKRDPAKLEPIDDLDSYQFWLSLPFMSTPQGDSELRREEEREYRFQVIQRALPYLDPHYQTVLIAHFHEKQGVAEMAKVLDASPHAVRMLIQRAKVKLRQQIELMADGSESG